MQRTECSALYPVQVFKHKPKKHYQRKTGHRQPLTKFLVTKISPATSNGAPPAAAAAEASASPAEASA